MMKTITIEFQPEFCSWCQAVNFYLQIRYVRKTIGVILNSALAQL